MHMREDWDDLRFVLAVAENGSVSAAARELGVNHATVLRHVAVFEERHDVEIFEKTARGYVIHDDKLRVIEAAREVENAMLGVRRIIDGAQAPLRGRVRVTSTDTFCNRILPPIIKEIAESNDELQIELMSTNAHLDLARMHAEITVRPSLRLPDDLKGEEACSLGFDVYAAPGCSEARWLGLAGPIARTAGADWMAKNVRPDHVVASADSFVTLSHLAAVGAGQAILPCIIGESNPRLERRRNVIPPTSIGLWVACHVDLLDVPRIRAVRRKLVQGLRKQADAIAGQTR